LKLETRIPRSRLISPLKRLFTDTDMHDPTLEEEMEEFYTYLQQIVQVDGLTIPSKDYDLVLDIMPKENSKIQWSYYYACHETRCLFWLKRYDAKHITSELDGVESPAHLSTPQASVLRSVFTNSVCRASTGGFVLVHGLSLAGLVSFALILL
jgi:hypothetical protein